MATTDTKLTVSNHDDMSHVETPPHTQATPECQSSLTAPSPAVAHAYHIMIANGLKPKNIIVMMEDDVANDEMNPFPGKLFNRPGKNPKDYYAGTAGANAPFMLLPGHLPVEGMQTH